MNEDNLENLVGISEFASQNKGFLGIIKQRFSDFQVNEISADGSIVRLTDLNVPDVVVAKDPKAYCEKPHLLTNEQVAFLHKMEQKKPKPAIEKPQKDTPYLNPSPPAEAMQLKINVTYIDKDTRKSLHEYIKSQFDSLHSHTKDIDGGKFVCISRKNCSNYDDRDSTWTKKNSHVNFVLYKENIDTMEAVSLLCSKLHLHPGVLCYGGTKDKRAKTSQIISAFKIKPENIANASKPLSKIRVGNFSFGSKRMKLGQISGNRFRVVLRDVQGTDAEIKSAMEELHTSGFINYFGLQRFSSVSQCTHFIGRAIIQNDWMQAVNLVMTPNMSEPSYMIAAKQFWFKFRDPTRVLDKGGKQFRNTIEGKLMSNFTEIRKPYIAFNMLPRNSKLMYVHAYQSYIFNQVLSIRISKYGFKVLPGDIVYQRVAKGINIPGQGTPSAPEFIDPTEDVPDAEEFECASVDENIRCFDNKEIHFLSAEEVDAVKITDILMPIPGLNTDFENEEIREWYEACLMRDGLTFEQFKNSVNAFSLGGAYRKMVVIPADLSYEVCYYDDPNLPLFQSDVEALENVDVEENKLNEGKYKAVLLELSLPTSSYATMALRELLKICTSPKFQSNLNEGYDFVKRKHDSMENNFNKKICQDWSACYRQLIQEAREIVEAREK